MDDQPTYGKVSKQFFEKIIYPNLGRKRNEVLVGPALGMDNCIINVGGGQVLVATTDPLSYIEEVGPEDSAWLSVHGIASDVATSGFSPQYAIFDFNLPDVFDHQQFERYWKALGKECNNLGIAIVGGHSGRFQGIQSTVIGAGTIFSFGSSRSYLTSGGAKAGESIIITKGVAIETTGVLARVFPNKIKEIIGEERLKIAQSYFKKISIIKDALTVTKVGLKGGGVSALHDATEGGVIAGLCELANASSVGIRIEKRKIPISNETKEICELFQIDPYVSLSEGTLVIACNPAKSEEAVGLLASQGVEAIEIGSAVEKSEGLRLVDETGSESEMKSPSFDPYWTAYYRAKEKGWT